MIAMASGQESEARALLQRAVAASAALPPLQVERARDALAGL